MKTSVPPLPPELAALVPYLDKLERRLIDAETTITSQGDAITDLGTDIEEITGEDAPPDNFSELFLHVQERTASGVDGKIINPNVWTIRDTTTEVHNGITGANVNGVGQVTLPAGIYLCMGFVPAWVNSTFRTRLFDTTAGIERLLSSTTRPGSTGSNTGIGPLLGRFTLPATSILEIQTNPQLTANAYQAAAIAGVEEIGANILFWKIG